MKWTRRPYLLIKVQHGLLAYFLVFEAPIILEVRRASVLPILLDELLAEWLPIVLDALLAVETPTRLGVHALQGGLKL